MKEHANSSVAPGIALKTLLLNAKGSALRELIGVEIVDTLLEIDPELVSDECLGKLAAEIIEPLEVFTDPKMRERVIRLLPLPKACELADKLAVSGGRELYNNLCRKASRKSSLKNLFSFFGVVQDPRAPDNVASTVLKTSAKYALFHHQRKAASKVIQALSNIPRKVVLHMPTGSGKTRTAMHVVASHLRVHEPTVIFWFAQNAELLDQAATEFEKAWGFLGNREVDILRFWGHHTADLLEIQDGIVVAGLAKIRALNESYPQTVLRLADRASLSIIDEAHQAIAPTYAEVLDTFYGKRPVNSLLGLTATPGRSWSDIDEDKKLSDYFDNKKVTLEVEGYSDPVSFLIEQKYLAQPIFRTLNSDVELVLSQKDLRELDSSVDITEDILNKLGLNTQRNLKILKEIEELLLRHWRVIVFAPSVENARVLSAILTSRGHESHIVTATSGVSERERIIRRFKRSAKKPMVLINYGVLTTGFDAPATSATVIARPTRSLVLYSQMVGRATRGSRVGGNEEAEIVTVVDTHLPGFGNIAEAFKNWEDIWNEYKGET